MFTGIVEETGVVESFTEGRESWRLVLRANRVLEDLGEGDSLACNGCCLTAIAPGNGRVSFDLLDETVRLTSFSQLKPGSKVNLERSLSASGRLGGHFVSGHVDATGVVKVFEQRGKNFYLRVEPPREFLKYLVYKGSVSIDGVSLTVAEGGHGDPGLAVWLIPHTLEVTNLCERKPGDRVNLEFDLLAKYMERLLLEGVQPQALAGKA